MNKILKILLIIIAGVEVTFTIILPTLFVILWVNIFGLEHWTSYLLYGVGLLATMFRAIRIGWLKDD